MVIPCDMIDDLRNFFLKGSGPGKSEFYVKQKFAQMSCQLIFLKFCCENLSFQNLALGE